MRKLFKYLRIQEAHYLPRYRVSLKFNDGKRRVVDFAPFLKRCTNPMFTRFRQLRNFKSFHVTHGDLMWGDFDMIFPIEELHKGKI